MTEFNATQRGEENSVVAVLVGQEWINWLLFGVVREGGEGGRGRVRIMVIKEEGERKGGVGRSRRIKIMVIKDKEKGERRGGMGKEGEGFWQLWEG